MEKIIAIVKCVNEEPKICEIDSQLKSLQQIVGGSIEMPSMPNNPNVAIVCNEEGKLIGLEPNVHYYSDIICGDIAVVAINDEGETVSLNEQQMNSAMEYLEQNCFSKVITLRELLNLIFEDEKDYAEEL